MELLYIRKSKNKQKKWVAVFRLDNGKERRIRFGAAGYDDYTIGASKDQRKFYRQRHQGDNLKDPLTPGALSYYILWGESTDMEKNIKTFKKRFKV
jgi:hypothetical protein